MRNFGNLEGLIPVAGGVYMFLLTVGILPLNPKDPEKLSAWRQKYSGMMIVLCPLIIIFGTLQLLGVFK